MLVSLAFHGYTLMFKAFTGQFCVVLEEGGLYLAHGLKAT